MANEKADVIGRIPHAGCKLKVKYSDTISLSLKNIFGATIHDDQDIGRVVVEGIKTLLKIQEDSNKSS